MLRFPFSMGCIAVCVGLLSSCTSGQSPISIVKWSTLSESASASAKGSYVVSWKCENTAKIKILMYHYVREEHEDQSGSIISRLSINPSDFLSQMQYLANLRDTWRAVIATMSDLERYSASRCYPNKHVIIPTSDDGWEDAYTDIFPVVKKYNLRFTLSIISKKVGVGSTHIAWFANEKEIREMIHSGNIEVQSHSVDHQDFKILSQTWTNREICDSKAMLEKEFNIRINTFIFPAGHTDAYALPALKKCWYRYALTTHRGDIDSSRLELERYTLPRVRLARGYDFSQAIRF